MAGYASPIDPVLDAPNNLVRQWGRTGADNNQGILASNPLQQYTVNSNTIGLGMTFAKDYVADMATGRQVLLVPCAANNTGFISNDWNPGNIVYEDAITRINAALAAHPGNVFRGALWHQGERDYTLTQTQYATALDAMIDNYRSRIAGANTMPFVCGETLVGGDFTSAAVTAALADTPNRKAYCGYVSSSGLTGEADNVHFTTDSLRTLGGRYYDEYISIDI